MCGFPSVYQPKKTSKSKHKKSVVKIYNSSGSHISITSMPGSIAISTGPPPVPKSPANTEPQTQPQPHAPAHPTYTHTPTTTCAYPHYSPYPFPPSQVSQPYAPPMSSPYTSTQWGEGMQNERERILSQVDFVNSLKEKLAPAKIEAPKQSEMEKKLLEEIGGLRKEWKEKEQKEEVAAAVAEARAQGVKEGRSERAIAGARAGCGYDNNRAYDSYGFVPDISTTFLAGIGAATLARNHRQRSRSRSRSRDRQKERPLYMLESGRRRGRRDSIEAIWGGIGNIGDRLEKMEGRLFDVDFGRGEERLRVVTGGYGGR